MSAAAKYTILSIDDSRAVHAFLDQCLEEASGEFAFLHAMGVKEGLEVLADRRREVSLVLLDWEMPNITGYDGLPMILSAFPDLPVVIATTKNNPEDISSMLERGAREYIMKPFTPDILFDKLRGVLLGL